MQSCYGLVRLGSVADEVGFEPTEPFGSLVFKTSALNHSATHPCRPFLGPMRSFVEPLALETVRVQTVGPDRAGAGRIGHTLAAAILKGRNPRRPSRGLSLRRPCP